MPDFATSDAGRTEVVTLTTPSSVLISNFFTSPLGYHVRRPAGTRDWLIFFTMNGQGRIRLGNTRLIAKPGDIHLLAPGAPHDYATASAEVPWVFYWAHFLPRTLWLPWLKLPEMARGLLSITIHDAAARTRIEQAFQRVVRDNADKGLLHEELSQNALEEVLILIAQQQWKQAPDPIDPRVAAVQAYLEQHYNQNVTLTHLAELVSLSPWRLSHLYRSQTGLTITNALHALRMRQAARLLQYTSRKVIEIAEDVGYQSQFHFSRQFKSTFHISPLAYRKHHQGDRS